MLQHLFSYLRLRVQIERIAHPQLETLFLRNARKLLGNQIATMNMIYKVSRMKSQSEDQAVQWCRTLNSRLGFGIRTAFAGDSAWERCKCIFWYCIPGRRSETAAAAAAVTDRRCDRSVFNGGPKCYRASISVLTVIILNQGIRKEMLLVH